MGALEQKHCVKTKKNSWRNSRSTMDPVKSFSTVVIVNVWIHIIHSLHTHIIVIGLRIVIGTDCQPQCYQHEHSTAAATFFNFPGLNPQVLIKNKVFGMLIKS